MLKRTLLGALLCTAVFTLPACTRWQKETGPPLRVMAEVDLKRYAGTWYEVASYPTTFQRGCINSRATYTLREDGTVGVLNECNRGAEGKLSSAKGTARVVDPATNAKLSVSFFWPFSGEYWIIDLGGNYEYAVVGHPSRQYLWVLSRTPGMDEEVYRGILERLSDQHYDTSRLVRTVQESAVKGR